MARLGGCSCTLEVGFLDLQFKFVKTYWKYYGKGGRGLRGDLIWPATVSNARSTSCGNVDWVSAIVQDTEEEDLIQRSIRSGVDFGAFGIECLFYKRLRLERV